MTESLEGSDFVCGDIVSFLFKIETEELPTDGNLDLNFQFTAGTTGQQGVAFTNAGANAFINYGDPAISDDGGSTVSNFSSTLNGPLFDNMSTVDISFRVTDLDQVGEIVVVRIDVYIVCDNADNATGNLQASFQGGSGSFQGGGNQTIPLKGAGNIIEDCGSCSVNTGPASLCPNGTGNYSVTIDGLCENPGYTWSVTGAGTLFSGQGTSSITVKANDVCSGTINVSVTITCEGCTQTSITCEKNVSINPGPLPVISCPSLPNVSCEEVATYDVPPAPYSQTNGCGISGTVSGTVVTENYNSCGGYLIVEYKGKDDCGRDLSPVRCTVYVDPAELPVISCPSLPNITCEEVAAYSPPDAPYSNGLTTACGISGFVSGEVVDSDYDACGGYLIVEYKGKDACGRDLSPVRCTVYVDPAELPVIECPSLPNITCEEVAAYSPTDAPYSNGLTTTCGISGFVSGEVVDSDYDACGGYLIVEYKGKDDCGRDLSPVRCTVYVDPAELPVITCPSLPNITCEEVAAYSPPDAPYSNGLTTACGISGFVSGEVVDSDYDACGGYLIVEYKGKDDCGRDLSPVRCTVYVDPAELPVITCPSLPNITCEEVAAYSPPDAPYSNGLTTTCGISGFVSGEVVDSDYDACGGYLIVEYKGKDDCGRDLSPVRCTVYVDPAELPVIECPSLPNITCEEVAAYSPTDAPYSNGLTTTCGISGFVSGEVVDSDYDACGGYLIVEYKGKDDCGRDLSPVRCTVYVDPAELPVIECPSLPNITCEEVAAYSPPDAPYSNGLTTACGISGFVSGEVVDSDYDACGGYLIVEYKGKDDCGRDLSPVRCTVYVDPAELPVITCPSLPNITCEEVAAYSPPDAPYSNGLTTTCGISGFVSGTVVDSDYDACGGYLIVEYKGKDDCGRDLSPVRCTVYVDPAELPVISCPSLPNITCEEVAAYSPPDAPYSNGLTTACGISGFVSGEVVDSDYDACGGYLIVEYKGKDDCGRDLSPVRCTVYVDPAELPVIECPSLPNITCEEVAAYSPPDAPYSNGLTTACGISGFVSGEVVDSDYDACGGYLIVEYKGKDDCGRDLSPVRCTVYVDPAELPVITCPSLPNITCEEVAAYSPPDAPYSNGLTTTCGISGFVSGTVVDSDYDACGGYLIVEYKGKDDCGRDLSPVRCTVYVDPAELPVIECPKLPHYLTCEEAETYMPPKAHYSNEVWGKCELSGKVSGSVKREYDACGGELIITYAGKDVCGRDLKPIHCRIPVKKAMLPVITCPVLPALLTCEEAETYSPPMASYSNGNSGACTLSGKVTGTVDRTYDACGGELIITYSGKDECGRDLAPITCIIPVTNAELPVISCPVLPTFLTCEEAESYTPPAAPYSNGNAGACTLSGAVSGDVARNYDGCGGELVITYSGKDECGRDLTPITCTIPVTNAELPVITCPTLPPISCDAVDTYVPPMASYSNGKGGRCTLSGMVSGEVTIPPTDGCLTSITVTYSGKDACGRDLAPITCTVPVYDNTPPVIEILQDEVTVECDNASGTFDPFDLPLDEIFTVSDNCSEPVIEMSDELVAVGDCGLTIKEYISKWKCTVTATDACGNPASAFFYVLIADTQPPVFIDDPADVTVGDCGAVVPVPNVRAVDQCSNVSIEYEEERIEGDCGGDYDIVRRWIATDGCGNPAELEQVVRVRDNVPPSMYFVGILAGVKDGSLLTIDCKDLNKYTSAELVRASDHCGPPRITFDYDYILAAPCKNRVRMQWAATDDCGNTTTLTVLADLLDQSAPELSGVPDDVCISGELPPVPEVKAYDACGQPTLTYEQTGPVDCGDGAVYYERTWTATDKCGNSTSSTQRITINDNTGPVIMVDDPAFDGVASGGTVTLAADCSQPDRLPALSISATDACSGAGEPSVTWTPVTPLDPGACEGVYTLSISATDGCGNGSTYEVTVNLTDQTPPVFTTFDDAITAECTADAGGVEAVDACGSEVTLSFSDATIDAGDVCAGTRRLRRTWTATDACGNAASRDQIVTVVDRTGPALIGVPDHVCGDAGPAPTVTAIDACSGEAAEVTLTEETFDGPCGAITIRTWSATDACGNRAEASQYIHPAGDDIAPVLTFTDPRLKDKQDGDLVEIEDTKNGRATTVPDFDETAVGATDNCEGPVDIRLDIELVSEHGFGDCDDYLAEYHYTWTATDVCGNSSSLMLVVRVVDTQPPMILNIPPFEEITVRCGQPIPQPTRPEAVDFNGIAMTDFGEQILYPADGRVIFVRTWYVTDYCGNTATAVQRVVVLNDGMSCTILAPTLPIACGSSGNTISATVSGGVAPYTYLWEMVDCDGIITGGQGTATITYNAGFTTQNFRLTVTDANGCVTVCTASVSCLKGTAPGGTQTKPRLNANLRDDRRVDLALAVERTRDGESIFIERSADGLHFQPIARLTAGEALRYETVDPRPLTGLNYYRASHQRHDGTTDDSEVILVVVPGPVGQVTIFPNPASQQVFVQIGQFTGRSGRIELYNALGQRVFYSEFDELPARPVAIDLHAFGSGIYTVVVHADGARASAHKVVVSKR